MSRSHQMPVEMDVAPAVDAAGAAPARSGRVVPLPGPLQLAGRGGPEPADYRAVLGRFATGVVVIAGVDATGEPVGMAANSFTSLSLTPPLVAFCAAHSSTTWPRLREGGGFAISILGAHQADTCKLFATKDADRFAVTDWSRSPSGFPVLDGSIGWIDCSLDHELPGGDHTIAVGRVLALGVGRDDEPLVFHGGHYGGFRR